MLRSAIRLTAACAGLLALAAAAAGPKQSSVQVRDGALRDSASFLGNVIATVNYADRVTILEEQGAWRKVTAPDGKTVGWIHSSALSKKKIVMEGSDEAKQAASSGELALAGKGFNSKVEAEFKSQHKDISFDWVNKMAAIKIAPKKLTAFLREGEVEPKKGGAK